MSMLLSSNYDLIRMIERYKFKNIFDAENTDGKRIVLFGNTAIAERIVFLIGADRICFICDNNKMHWGTSCYGVQICPPTELSKHKDVCVFICAFRFAKEITGQLRDMNIPLFNGYTELFPFLFDDAVSKESIVDTWNMIMQVNKLASRCSYNSEEFTMPAQLKKLRKYIGDNCTVIDIGASHGIWTEIAMQFFPDSKFFMIEARKEHENGLKNVCRQSRSEYVIAAAGNKVGEVNFNITEDLYGGGASHEVFCENNSVVQMVSVDYCIKTFKLKPPYVLKFDTHGFELEILDGAAETLENTKAIIMEMYNFKLGEGLLFPDMCKHLEGLDFRCAMLAEPLSRPCDGALWQMDLIFVRNENAIFKNIAFS